jgi:hypothetical protein
MKTLLAFAIGITMLVLAVAVTGVESYNGFQDINWNDYMASFDGKISINPFQNPVAIKEPEFQVPDLPGLPTGCDATKMSDISEWYTMPNQPIPPAPKMPEVPEVYAPKMEIPQIEIPKAIFTQPELPMPTMLPPSGTVEEIQMAFVAQEWLAETLGVPFTSVKVTEVTRGGCFSACPPDAEVCMMVCVEGYIVTCDVLGEIYQVATDGDDFYFVE